jgi:glycosyltransferase involved in cell wall biosynthesis
MKISIIVPVYNTGKYLNRCIDSIVAQTYKNWELILVDDGSTDQSPAMCDRYASEDDRIRAIHQSNCGHTAARLSGLNAGDGEYVLFADSDDWIEPGMLDALAGAAVSCNADISQCGYFADKQDGTVIRAESEYQEGIYDKRRLQDVIYPTMIYHGGRTYGFGIAPNMWNKLIKRSLAEKYLPGIDRTIRNGEDGLLVYQCMMEAEKFADVKECYYHYCSNDGSVSKNIGAGRIEENHRLFNEYHRLWGDDPLIMGQLYHYVVYQTLQAVGAQTEGSQLKKVRERCLDIWGRDSIEQLSIKKISCRDITGKRNRILLLWMKTWKN